jgi:hypothetical protein
MIDPSLDLQGALIAALRGNLGAAVGARVYDQAPASPPFPYVTLGDCQVLPDKADCIDGVEAYPVIDAWSRKGGYPEVKSIAAAIIAVLDDQPLAIEGFDVVVFELQSVQYLRDPDGLTRHASLTFRTLIQPT